MIEIDPKTTEGHRVEILTVEGSDPLGKRIVTVQWGPHTLRITQERGVPTGIEVVQAILKDGQYAISDIERLMLDLAAGRSTEGDGSFRSLIHAVLHRADKVSEQNMIGTAKTPDQKTPEWLAGNTMMGITAIERLDRVANLLGGDVIDIIDEVDKEGIVTRRTINGNLFSLKIRVVIRKDSEPVLTVVDSDCSVGPQVPGLFMEDANERRGYKVGEPVPDSELTRVGILRGRKGTVPYCLADDIAQRKSAFLIRKANREADQS